MLQPYERIMASSTEPVMSRSVKGFESSEWVLQFSGPLLDTIVQLGRHDDAGKVICAKARICPKLLNQTAAACEHPIEPNAIQIAAARSRLLRNHRKQGACRIPDVETARSTIRESRDHHRLSASEARPIAQELPPTLFRTRVQPKESTANSSVDFSRTSSFALCVPHRSEGREARQVGPLAAKVNPAVASTFLLRVAAC